MSRFAFPALCGLMVLSGTVLADSLLYQYEGDVVPYDESAGWLIANACDGACSESLEDGHFVTTYKSSGDLNNYHLWIAEPPEPSPPTLWAEWRFRSNHPLVPEFVGCDAWFTVRYGTMFDLVQMNGDAVVSNSGGDAVVGLDINEFHTLRYESLDGGNNYLFAVDGQVFVENSDDTLTPVTFLQMGGAAGCNPDVPTKINEWDFVRHGELGFGEQIVSVDPPSGYLDPDVYAGLDRFAITFDSPNYVYIADITVEVSGGDVPIVTQTWRRDGDGPETLEIVLDKPIPPGEHTRFIIGDGTITNIVDYSFIQGDADGDGDLDLRDFAVLENCFHQSPPTGVCNAFDFNDDETIDLTDHATFVDKMGVVNP